MGWSDAFVKHCPGDGSILEAWPILHQLVDKQRVLATSLRVPECKLLPTCFAANLPEGIRFGKEVGIL